MNTSIPWEWYRTFLAVLQEGSLSGASRTLNITQPTAGRHIAGLEAALGQALFTRSQTGLLATDAALALRVHAEAMDNTARALERTAANFSRDRTELRGLRQRQVVVANRPSHGIPRGQFRGRQEPAGVAAVALTTAGGWYRRGDPGDRRGDLAAAAARARPVAKSDAG